MPEALENHIKNIQTKIQLLLKRHTSLQKENQKLLKENSLAAETNRQLMQKVNLLQQQVHILKTSTGTLEGKEKLDFEKTVHEYIKTIDKCISILNK